MQSGKAYTVEALRSKEDLHKEKQGICEEIIDFK